MAQSLGIGDSLDELLFVKKDGVLFLGEIAAEMAVRILRATPKPT
jgi:hypothetical protein